MTLMTDHAMTTYMRTIETKRIEGLRTISQNDRQYDRMRGKGNVETGVLLSVLAVLPCERVLAWSVRFAKTRK